MAVVGVRAKFKVQRIERVETSQSHQENGKWVQDPPIELQTVVMNPVSGNGDPSHENTKFWKLSPSGELKLGTINPDAWQYFELGKEYYLDFTLAQ